MLPPDDMTTVGSNKFPDEREMKKYGIECIPIDYFHYREFRYTTSMDAIAQAKRDEASGERGARHGSRKIGP